MVIEKVHAVRDYRAWREGAFDFSIYLEEDGSEYIVQVDQGNRHVHPIVKLVERNPGITVAEAASLLKVTPSAVKNAATKYNLVKRRERADGKGRPKTGLYLPR
jgi:hypothetical protein